MENLGFVRKLTTLGILLLAVASTCGATVIPVRGASGYGIDAGASGSGPDFGYSTCVGNIINFLNNVSTDNCEGFVTGTFTIGGNSYVGDQFAFLEPSGTGFGTLDVLQIAGGSSLTLTLLNPALPTGVFMCGGSSPGSSVAQDSQSTDLPGLSCTSGSSSGFAGTQDVSNVQALFSLAGVTFVNGTSGPITIFTQDGNIVGSTFTPGTPTSVPEPSSVILLGAGLLGVWGGRKRLVVR